MSKEYANSKKQNTWTGLLRTTALIAVMLISTALAARYALIPMLEKERMLNRQAELLASIESGSGAITLDDDVLAGDVDFYDTATSADNDYKSTGSDEYDSLFLHDENVDYSDQKDNYPLEITGIGILTIEKIDLTLPVTNGVSEAQLKIAVGHMPQTAPIGETGNAVIAGHRSYTYGQYFNRLGELAVGDIIKYRGIDGKIIEFEVYEILEVLPGDYAAFEQPENKQVLTLYTCTPIRTATHRLLVRAQRIFYGG